MTASRSVLRALIPLMAVLGVGAGALFPAGVQALQAPPQERTIVLEAFNAVLQVDSAGELRVTERIRLRFSGEWNGIIRSLPVQYRTPSGFDYTLHIRDVDIRGEDGSPLRVEQERAGIFRDYRIWVPDAADAVREITLQYRVENALRFSGEHDELYWNVTGDEWVYPIESASAEIRLPPGVTGVRSNVFTGRFGEAGSDATTEELENGFRVQTTRNLGIREGLTVAVAWNPGVVYRPTTTDRVLAFLRANFLLVFPFLSLGLMWRVWYTRGRDPELRPIAPAYQPPEGMRPAEVGTLVDHSPDMRDITASIVDLAVRGYLRIEEEAPEGFAAVFRRRPEYRLVRLSRPTEVEPLHPHEEELLQGLFASGSSVEMDDLENTFYTTLPKVKTGIFRRLIDEGFYARRPDQVQGAWVGIGVVVLVFGTIAAFMLSERWMLSPLTAILAGVLTSVPVFAFGAFMPARTQAGARALEEILGFREFLDRVEEDRFKRMITSPAQFEAFLPYAMALGVEKKWARAFEGIFKDPPSWYVGSGYGPGTFRPTYFVGNLSQMSSRAASVMASQPRSSGGSGFSGGGGGGGFSGGGFGGGGGRGF